MPQKILLVLLFLFLLGFRTFFGLSKPFFGDTIIEQDALQTYLIGLKPYTTNTWPYFGPDQYELDTGYHTQIAGALEPLSIDWPLRVWPIPEAPFLFLNLLSLSGLGLLAWYIWRRSKNLPFWFILVWACLLPWNLNESCHVLNICYVLFGACLFFVGFFEAIPEFSIDWLTPGWAFSLMSFGIFWNMQFHLSWVLQGPFLAGAFLWRRYRQVPGWGREVIGLVLGAAPPLAFVIPTWLAYGFDSSSGGLTHTAHAGFDLHNFGMGFTILARYYSLVCFEMPRFIGGSTAERTAFLKEVPWIIPPAIWLTLVGWIQPFLLLAGGWIKGEKVSRNFWLLQSLAFAGFLWVWSCFSFSAKEPMAHMYYVLLPLLLVYSMAVWDRLAPIRWVRVLAVICIGASLWFQTGMALKRLTEPRSLYHDRDRVVKAIDQKDYRILGERRPWAH